MAFAGGIVTNSNQSAKWVRMLSRDASTDIDAVYYNPAGVVALGNGFHFSLSNQIISQEYILENDLTGLRLGKYVGDVDVPLYPNVYASYNKEKWAVSFGFGPIGGGGSAEYADGLPQFDMLLMSNFGANPATAPLIGNYDVDMAFEGSSVFLGTQLGIAYKLNDVISASLGARLVLANNEYTGHIQDITSGGVAVPFPAIEVDATQSAVGFTPIIGLNFTPMEQLNIGLRWEGNTSLEFTNDTEVDGSGMFQDNAKTNRDIPMTLSVGIGYKISEVFRAQLGYHSYFDGNADWDGREDNIDHNLNEFSLGLEYDINDMFTVSAGYLKTYTGVSEAYQQEMSFSLSSSNFAFGGQINLNEQLSFDIGYMMINYDDMEVASTGYTTTYGKDGWMFALGVNYSVF